MLQIKIKKQNNRLFKSVKNHFKVSQSGIHKESIAKRKTVNYFACPITMILVRHTKKQQQIY